MFQRIPTTRRVVVAAATTVLLTGPAAAAGVVAPASGARADDCRTYPYETYCRTDYYFFSDATYSEIVGEAASGCGEPFAMYSGQQTIYVRTSGSICPI